jgi:hypothetical protein
MISEIYIKIFKKYSYTIKMDLLEILFMMDGIVFIYIMISLIVMTYAINGKKIEKAIILPREGFCTCRGMQFNNSEADVHQENCYKNRIPANVWDKSHAGCTSTDDAGKIAYDYEIRQKQLPQFSGV